MAGVHRDHDISHGIEPTPIALSQDVPLEELADFVYVRHNVPGEGISETSFEQSFGGCNCPAEGNCDESCICSSSSGQMYDESHRLNTTEVTSQAMKPVYECNIMCKCSQTCQNRLVQHSVNLKLCVFKTNVKNFGVKCLEAIPQNAFLCEYAGEVVSLDVGRSRMKNLKRNEPNYLLTVTEHYMERRVQTCVDPRFIGNVGRFINHSCEPNLHMIPVRINHDIPHLALFAIREIQLGEELSFDYSGIVHEEWVADTDVKDELYADRTKCQCNSDHCRGYLPFDEISHHN